MESNMKKLSRFTIPCLMLLAPSVMAASPFSCGEYNPTVAISPSSDLALTTTGMVASPGHPLLPGSFSEAGWFTSDPFGTCALMGCSPKKSVIQGWSQVNSYNDNGTLNQVVAQRFNSGGGDPLTATLDYTYESDNPFYLATAENFCMSIGAEKVKFSFEYAKGLLVGMKLVPDSGCPSNAPVDIVFKYGDSNVPKLPTTMVVNQQGKDPETSTYKYNIDGGKITSYVIGSSQGNMQLNVGYTQNLITSITGSGVENNLSYRNGNQWASMLDPRYNWGLTIDYYSTNKIESTLQNTGWPQAQPDHFYY